MTFPFVQQLSRTTVPLNHVYGFGATLSVTRALKCADGRSARSVEEFRRR